MIRLCLLIAAASLAACGYTGNSSTSKLPVSLVQTEIKPSSEQTVLIRINNPEAFPLHLQIDQMQGELMMLDTTLKGSSHAFHYSFQMADDGPYKVTVRGRKYSWKKVIDIKTQKTVTRTMEFSKK